MPGQPKLDGILRVVECSFAGCGGEVVARGYCTGHYTQWKRGRPLTPLNPRRTKARLSATVKKPCSFEGCGLLAKSKGLCQAHYTQHYRGQELRPLRNRMSPRNLMPGASSYVYEDGTKYCSQCLQRLPLASFHRNAAKSSGYDVCCSSCRAELYGTSEKVRERGIRRKYGLSIDEYNRLLSSQGGGCAICGDKPDPSKKVFAVDHDHSCCPSYERTCGKCVRGILCSRCNTSIGMFEDDVELMAAAIVYLNNAKREEVA